MNSYLAIGALILDFLGIAFLIYFKNKSKKKITASFVAKTAIFAALATILYVVPFLKFSLPIFPNFLEIHFDEIPALIAGFAYGPLSGLFVILIKTLIKVPFTTSLGVGELADLIYGILLVVPASIIYKRRRHIKGAVMGLGFGSLIQTVLVSLITSFIILNFYIFVMGLSEETIISMCKAINPNINELGWSFFICFALPFNALKNLIVSLLTLFLYKKTHYLIDKIV